MWHDQGRLGDHEQQFERVLERPLTHRSLDTLIELVYALDELLVIAGATRSSCAAVSARKACPMATKPR